MPIKGIFNQKNLKQLNIDELDKLNLRMNALEVQNKKLFDLEKQLRLSIYNSKEKSPISSHENKKSNTIQNQDVFSLIDKIVSEKFALLQHREEQLLQKIHGLERQVAELKKRENEAENTTIDQRFSDLFDSMQMRLLSLEQNFELVYDEQKILVKQVEKFEQNNSECAAKTIEVEESKEVPIQPIYIDKLYVDKYEQNNNFSQLGIKSLSGSLNIGATYGSVPQKANEQVKKDFDKIRSAMEEMQNPNTENQYPNHEKSSTESENPQQSEIYTEIEIEED